MRVVREDPLVQNTRARCLPCRSGASVGLLPVRRKSTSSAIFSGFEWPHLEELSSPSDRSLFSLPWIAPRQDLEKVFPDSNSSIQRSGLLLGLLGVS